MSMKPKSQTIYLLMCFIALQRVTYYIYAKIIEAPATIYTFDELLYDGFSLQRRT